MTNPKSVFYFDSSVILRFAIGHENAIHDFSPYTYKASTSAITIIECLRVLDRWRITKEISDKKLVDSRTICLQILNGLRIVSIDDSIVSLASQTFPIALKSLDAIHLATAIHLQNETKHGILLLTHDIKLQMAAIAMNIEAFPKV